MPKNIVFCADGTWNGPGQDEDGDGRPDPTNVYRLFANLQGDVAPLQDTLNIKEQEKAADAQIAKYLHGVGNSNNLLVHLLGGGFGAGTVARLARGLTFISRNYEQGDTIYMVGFSRGAYTARVLGGFITDVGLLDRNKLSLDDKETAYRYAMIALLKYFFRRRGEIATFFHQLASKVLGGVGDFLSMEVERDHMMGAVPIMAIAVWETVGALGIPTYHDKRRIDLFQFANRSLHQNIRHGLHALSIDERRGDFTPTLWLPRDGVEQVWFPGSHSDVGGGYPDTGLSDLALEWMQGKLKALGMQFSPLPAFITSPNALAPARTPWNQGIWQGLPQSDRLIPKEPPPQIIKEVNERLEKLSSAPPSASLRPFRLQEGNGLLDPQKCTLV